jgi:L-ascorbate metabolism protein UlaG (beta-lactamase superfamily)
MFQIRDVTYTCSSLFQEKGSAEMDPYRATYIGHSTVLIKINGQYVLTDPNFNHRTGILKRHAPPGLEIEDLPELSLILISHSHLDHLDLPTLRKIDPRVPIVVPTGVKSVLRSLKGRKIIELKRWESLQCNDLKINATPAAHHGGRWIIDDFFRKSLSYVIEGPEANVYFAGDTAIFKRMREIGELFDLDLAVLPIGAYRPPWMMMINHMNPSDAVEAFGMLKARYMLPIHWGAFRLSTERPETPARWLRKYSQIKGLEDKIKVLDPGESFSPL